MLFLAGGQPSVEGDVEGVQGGLPAVGPALSACPGGVKTHNGKVDAFERGLLGGEVPAGIDRSPDAGVDALNGVGRADDRADLPVELQERHELGPGVGPEPGDSRVAFLPFLAELDEPVQRVGLGRRGVDGLEVLGDRGPVLLRRVAEGVAQQVNNAGLGDGLGPDGGDGLRAGP
jgi:hypothetical protein